MSGPIRIQLSILWLSLGVFLGAQSDLEISARDWKWGIQAFQGDNLRQEDGILLENFPELLFEGIGDIPQRILTEKETDELIQSEYQRRRTEALTSLAQALDRRDMLFFENKLTQEEAESQEQLIEESRLALEQVPDPSLLQLGSDGIWPVKFEPSSQDQPFYSASDQLPQDLMEKQGLDALITGALRRSGDYLRLTISIHLRLEKSHLEIVREGFSPGEASLRVENWYAPMRTELLGAPWAGLNLIVRPPDAEIFVNDTYHGTGQVTLRELEPGRVNLLIRRSGFQTVQRELVLDPELTLEEVVILNPLTTEALYVSSVPQGAEVYLGSLYRGITPLELDAPINPSLMTISRPGFFPREVFLDSGSSGEQLIELTPRTNRQSLLEAKDDFYFSLSLFTLSFFSSAMVLSSYQPTVDYYNSMTQKFIDTYGTAGIPTEEEIFQQNFALTLRETTYWAGITMGVVTAGLFGYLIWELTDYILVGEGEPTLGEQLDGIF